MIHFNGQSTLTITNHPDNDAIKTMKLYTNVERIHNELASQGIFLQTSGQQQLASPILDPLALSEIDSMHYMGNSAIEDALLAMRVDSSSRVLDVGSGFGGVARILSYKSNCHCVALELQSDIHHLGKNLTRHCNLSKFVHHVQGDVLDCDLETLGDGPLTFDGVMSFLVFLHIPNKSKLLQKCATMLKHGGILFVEDFYCLSDFSELETAMLANDVFCKDLPKREEYIAYIQASGFEDIQFIDMTKQWTIFVSDRLEKFIEQKERFISIHGVTTYHSLLEFYKTIVVLFQGQNLGGVRIIARKT